MLQMENNHVNSLAHCPVVASIFLPISRFAKALPKLILNISVRTSRRLWAAALHSIGRTRLENSKLSILSCLLHVCYHLILPFTILHWVLFFSEQVTALFRGFLRSTNKLLFPKQLSIFSRRGCFLGLTHLGLSFLFLACRKKKISSEVSNANYSTCINIYFMIFLPLQLFLVIEINYSC